MTLAKKSAQYLPGYLAEASIVHPGVPYAFWLGLQSRQAASTLFPEVVNIQKPEDQYMQRVRVLLYGRDPG